MVRSCRKLMEETVRWMFRVGAESEWFVFARTVIGFWILSQIGNLLDFHTFLIIGKSVPSRLKFKIILGYRNKRRYQVDANIGFMCLDCLAHIYRIGDGPNSSEVVGEIRRSNTETIK